MPTYEYRCPRGHEFEKFYRSIGTAEANPDCPQCGLPAERQMSAAGFAFKGSGFYLTDYGKNAHREKPPAGTNGKAPTEGGADAAAPAAKSDAAPASSGDATPSTEPKKGAAKPAEAAPAAPSKKSTGE